MDSSEFRRGRDEQRKAKDWNASETGGHGGHGEAEEIMEAQEQVICGPVASVGRYFST